MLNLVDRYILREWLKIFGLALVAMLGLLLLQSLYEDLSNLLEQQAKILDVLVYFSVKVLAYFSIVLPLALLLSLLYALGQLHRNSELTALRAAGLGLFRITRSIWVVGVLLCVMMGWFTASVIPWSVEEARFILQNLRWHHEARTTGAAQVGVRASVAFDNQRAGRMWFFNHFSQPTGIGQGAMVVELDAQQHEKTRLLAREAWRDPAGGWTFRAGREIWLDPVTGDVTRAVEFTEKHEAHFSEDPELMFIFDLPAADLSLRELGRIIDYYEAEQNPKVAGYAVRYYALLADAMVPLIVILLALPFAAAGVRVNPAVGASKAIGFFLLYYALVKISYAFGARDLVPAQWAALLPNVVMLGLGGIFFARVR